MNDLDLQKGMTREEAILQLKRDRDLAVFYVKEYK